ncbi:hypothetical protein ACTMTI_24670 [Nonomuraea sp. H19]|uniref:hypothetical protein n=1 Tax=Nonomuraea sp. H19 TaxID=3452206 RepID=UPI003F8C287F
MNPALADDVHAAVARASHLTYAMAGASGLTILAVIQDRLGMPREIAVTATARSARLDGWTVAVIVGRSLERSRLMRLVADAKDSRGRSLVVRGEAGIGKTA